MVKLFVLYRESVGRPREEKEVAQCTYQLSFHPEAEVTKTFYRFQNLS